MKKHAIFFAALMTGASLWADTISWSTPEELGQWKSYSNVKCELKEKVLVLTDIKADSQLISPVLKMDASLYECCTFRYRATGTTRSSGEIFYAHENGRFSGRAYWQIPALIADGEWHTMVLTRKNLNNPVSWFEGGMVTRLRFDPTNAPGGKIEIADIRFCSQKELAPTPAEKKKVTAAGPFPPDEPEWPEVKPELRNIPVDLRGEIYYSGSMIVSPEDKKGSGKSTVFYLRKEFELKDTPVLAWLQFTADDTAEAFLNGVSSGKCSHWRNPEVSEVSSDLKKGKNVWAFCYKNSHSAGGVFGELFVRYADGTMEKIPTDGSFRTSLKAESGWNKTGFDAKGWTAVLTHQGPPNAPWSFQVPYRNFACTEKFIRASAVPDTPEAGSKAQLTYVFQGNMPSLPFSGRLVMRNGDRVMWQEPFTLGKNGIRKLDNGMWCAVIDWTVPRYLAGGKFDVRLESCSIFCNKGGSPETQISLHGMKYDKNFPYPLTVRVGQGAYGPCVNINGKNTALLWGAVPYTYRRDRMGRFGDAPLNVVSVYGISSDYWPSCGKTDFSSFDRIAEMYHRQNPDAWFIWDLSIYPPKDWGEKYPDEMCRDEKGEIVDEGYRLCYSFASKQALKDMMEVMEKAITYLENSPYANRIIGYRINSGHTIEWLGWDPKRGRATDFSPAAKKAFREFVQKNYPELKDYSIPTLKERYAAKRGDIFWDAQKHLNVIAYHDFYSQASADMLIALHKRAKEILHHKKLTGTYYGYCATLHIPGNSHMRAHYALRKVLNSGAVDFLMSPHAYGIRNIGGTCSDMKVFETLRKSGIMPIIEDDTRTHNGPWVAYSSSFQTVTEAATLGVMRRNLGVALCRNEICYLYALCNTTEMDFPAMAEDLKQIRAAGEFCLEKQVARNAEIAAVFSERSILATPMLTGGEVIGWQQRYLPTGKVQSDTLNGMIVTGETFQGNIQRFARIGAPVDFLLAEDLKAHPGNYKIYIFLNCYAYDKEFLESVEQLKKRKCTLVWLYAPGYIYNLKNGVENMQRLTGITLKQEEAPQYPRVTFPDGSKMGGCTTRITPTFYADDPRVQILGKNDSGHAGLVSMQVGKARSIFSCAYRLDIPFLQKLAKENGVHLYSESSDPMEANSALVSLHARFPGKKTICLPRKTNVVDVINKKIIAENVDHFTFDAPLHSSWIFYYGDDAAELLKK